MSFLNAEFWASLPLILKIYWIAALSSSLVFTLLLILTLIGGDHGHSGDIDHADHSFASSILSLRTLTAFFMAASWTGIYTFSSGVSLLISLLISLFSGGVLMCFCAGLFTLLLRLQSNGATIVPDDLIGCRGDVYVTVHPNSDSSGQVQILVKNSLRTYNAVSVDNTSLSQFTKIEVVDLLDDDILLVKSIND